MLQLPAIEADLYGGLQMAGIDVLEVRSPAGGLSNVAYAKIRPRGAGDAKQALGVMLTCSKQALPKVAMVFDEPSADVVEMSEEELTADMRAFIEQEPRTWRDIYAHYNGQNYQVMLRAFGNLRHQLGRVDSPPPCIRTRSRTARSWEKSLPTSPHLPIPAISRGAHHG